MDQNKQKLEYFTSSYIDDIQALYIQQTNNFKIDRETTSIREIREFMFRFFQSQDFNNLYFKFARQIIDFIKIPPDEIALQMFPTPRVFKPNSIGTSYHCDYWYGHGEKSYTIWVPLSPIEKGNTFHVANENLAYKYFMSLQEGKIYKATPDELACGSTPVLPEPGQAFVFNSKLLHGSPLNFSNKTRISFDFRISSASDKTSTKDIENYYHFIKNTFQLPRHELDGSRVLKYICGGIGKNTFIQHVIIEAAAKRFNMNVHEQEAEIERMGYPVFLEYVNENLEDSKFDAMIIASKHILDHESFSIAKTAKIKVWCALENDFLFNL
jgi:hypothetical protein